MSREPQIFKCVIASNSEFFTVGKYYAQHEGSDCGAEDCPRSCILLRDNLGRAHHTSSRFRKDCFEEVICE